MPSFLKQSLLPFFSPTKKQQESLLSATDSILIDDSDDDGWKTPPLPLIKTARKSNDSNSVVIELMQDRSGASKEVKDAPVVTGKDKEQEPPTKKVKRPNKPLDSETQPVTKEEISKSNAAEARSILCHQHRHACSTLLQCTRMKSDGSRCPNKYCYQTLQRVYKQDAKQIISAGRNVLGVSIDEHVGPELSSYLWKCPKCRGGCQCSICRKKLGLEPLGNKKADGQSTASTSKRVADDDIDGTRNAKKTAKALDVIISNKLQSVSEPQAAISRITLPLNPLEMSQQAGPSNNGLEPLSTDPSPGVAAPALDPAHAKIKATLQQQTFQKPIRNPKPVELPQMTLMETKLPVPNIMERLWLYESLIRFDWFKIPKSILNHLDKFDEWTESQVQTVLERLICSIADINSAEATPTRNIHKRLLEAFQLTGDDLNRGEAWEAAREYCLTKEARMVKLKNIEPLPHQKGKDRKTKDVRWNKDETLLAGRHTRNRRLAEIQAMERVKKISIKEMESSDESDQNNDSTEETSLVESSDEEAPRISRRSRGGVLRKSARQRGITVKRASVSDSEDDLDMVKGDQSAGTERSESVVQVLKEVESAAPLSAPPFEQRIAILSSLVDVLMQSKQCNQEIIFGFKQSLELEKAGKEEEKELFIKQEEELKEFDRNAPSMTMVEEFCQWKEDKVKLIKEHSFASLDLRINMHLQIELHKSRCEALGIDSDGNEYWQLSEYVETKPQDTTGRWAWSLLVLGSSFGKVDEIERQSSTALQPIEVDSGRVSGNVTPVSARDEKAPINDGIVVQIDVPLRKTPYSPEKAGKESIKTPELQSSPLGEFKVEDQAARLFSGTSDHESISQLIEYIQYRMKLVEFEEQQEFRQKIQAEEARVREAAIESEGLVGSSLHQDANASGNMLFAQGEKRSSNHEKAQIKERQKQRRVQVEQLLKRLEIVVDYYKWHHEGEEEEVNDDEA